MANENRLIDANEFHNRIWYGNSDSIILRQYASKLLEEAPTVDAVEVVHGRWVHKGAWRIECSECKHILAHIGEAKNYCPNCGAKMDDEEVDV